MTRRFLALQKTLKNEIRCNGIGVHSGERVSAILRPAQHDTGIVFRRVDLPGEPAFQARYDRVTDGQLCTSIGDRSGAGVATVEHLMAAFAGLEIDNAVVELDGPEVPAMDGSSAPFVFLIECADVIEQAAPRRYIQVLKPVRVEDGGRSVSLEPGPGFSLSFVIDFDNRLVGHQHCDIRLNVGRFKSDLAYARSFGFIEDVDRLREMGLARGGSLENAVVVDGDRVLNEGGLRYPDEFVRHKALDALGDLYLAGGPILGRFSGERSGHALNNRLVRELMADRSAWRYVIERDVAMAPVPVAVPMRARRGGRARAGG
jgi:UDP-3-O-[3-hydroxymyristoyl] N-acetylglucosamine deacetylase